MNADETAREILKRVAEREGSLNQGAFCPAREFVDLPGADTAAAQAERLGWFKSVHGSSGYFTLTDAGRLEARNMS